MENGCDEKSDLKRKEMPPADLMDQELPAKKKARMFKKIDTAKEPALVLTMMRLDPILQFLTRATGMPLVPMSKIKATLPSCSEEMLKHMSELAERGVLQIVGSVDGSGLSWTDQHVSVGFPPPPSMDAAHLVHENGTLHGSTKTAAKRRLAALRRSLKAQPGVISAVIMESKAQNGESTTNQEPATSEAAIKDWSIPVVTNDSDIPDEEDEVVLEEERQARSVLMKTLNLSGKADKALLSTTRQKLTVVLPKQASYSGSHPQRDSQFATLDEQVLIPPILLEAFGIERPRAAHIISTGRKLYTHQVSAVTSALKGTHTLVCTGTGSGKSLCFLLPVLTTAFLDNETSLLLFPTKALAQDQMTKLLSLLQKHPDLRAKIRPGIIDGDTSHADRSDNAKNCNIVLTNPDTLHAAILPGWRNQYKLLLGRIKYVVIDEAHMYEGVFGAHVAMVLSRLLRLTAVCSHKNHQTMKLPVFLACSATMSHPEHHFRLLCPISKEAAVTVLSPDDDGSPRAAKHFFVWNPPIMDINGVSTGRMTVPRSKQGNQCTDKKGVAPLIKKEELKAMRYRETDELRLAHEADMEIESSLKHMELYRRHAADETALLLARAVSQGVRCIAFCKTRCLVEWVYERTVSALNADKRTQHLACRVESYRGGYTTETRRSIESRLFNDDLLGVVATNALELGVDVGGIDLTLHCGYPTSYASLLQQAGRAGRGGKRLDVPSLAIMVCFNSPAEQHIWRHPKSLLGRGLTAQVSIPVHVGLVQGHLLCAGEEYPLNAGYPVSALFCTDDCSRQQELLKDQDLFGSSKTFREAIVGLLSTGLAKEELLSVAIRSESMNVYKTHPFVDKPWKRVNLRSIEPVNYAIVDLSHPLQGGQMDGIRDEQAVLDNIPYSRLFYHAFPGAIITHRGRKYKVQSMTRPPAFADSCSSYRGGTLAAFAKPTSASYFTRPLSTLKITVVKQMERVDVSEVTQNEDFAHETTPVDRVYTSDVQKAEEKRITEGSLAGNGVVNVRRSVHGYKKLSAITRVELSRTELSLPAMEFDTFAFWLDTEASALRCIVKEYDEGVHALSHAILSAAPLFVPCGGSDLNCDHTVYDCTRIVIFDMRAGGSGNCAQLFKHIFVPGGLLHTAVELMENCGHCQEDPDRGYQGGCPACVHFGQCLKFNQHLNRIAAVHIGKRLLKRVEQTTLFKENAARIISEGRRDGAIERTPLSPESSGQKLQTPRRKARERALREAKQIKPTKERGVVLGRPSWPTDEDGPGGRQVQADL